MESNKEEAMRAKRFAENKMQNNDFYAAKNIILEAQQLFPDLENVNQMLTICEVHCAAQTKIGGSSDWYGILQVSSGSDYSVIRKQYMKLALILHPDKNKFGGAETAFKLIEEAHRTLSDQKKWSLPMQTQASTINMCSFCGSVLPVCRMNEECTCWSCMKTIIPKPIEKRNYDEEFNFEYKQEASDQYFWTRCSFCGLREECLQTRINKSLRCRCCLNDFIAYDKSAKYIPSVSDDSLQDANKTEREHGPSNKKPRSTYCRYDTTMEQGFTKFRLKASFDDTDLVTFVFSVNDRCPLEFKFDSKGDKFEWNRAILSNAMDRLVYPILHHEAQSLWWCRLYDLLASRVNELEETLFFHLDYILYKLRKDNFRHFSGVTVFIELSIWTMHLCEAREKERLGPNEHWSYGPYRLLIRPDYIKNDRCNICAGNLDQDRDKSTCLPYCFHGFHLKCLQKYLLEDVTGIPECPLCNRMLPRHYAETTNRLKRW